jgi:hypothetical protein
VGGTQSDCAETRVLQVRAQAGRRAGSRMTPSWASVRGVRVRRARSESEVDNARMVAVC